MIYTIKYKTRDGFCEFDHNGECLTCDCWASDCAFIRMENEDYKYETAEDFERLFGVKQLEKEAFFKELYSVYEKTWNEKGEPGLVMLVQRLDGVSNTKKLPDFLFEDVILVDEAFASQIGLTLAKTQLEGLDRWALCKYQKLDKLQIPNTRTVFENSKTRFEILSYEKL